MKTKIYFSPAFLMLLLIACNNNSVTDPEFNYNKINKEADTGKNASQLLIPDNKTQTSIIPAATTSTSPTTNSTTTNTTTSTAPATNSTATGKNLNPPHGQPGHRCDIAVGAPLDSKPATTTNNTTPTTTATNQIKPSAGVTTKTVTAPGINPPHGQPGHRCEIAVGAPLNSKPVTTATSQKQTTAATTKTVTAPGMNPPHGEPGHRCDIGVGTPLSQPVKTNTDQQNTKTISPIMKDSAKN